MTIPPTLVKELRDKTNAGFMDCKKALEESKGNLERAIEILRKKGLNVAQKKAVREASEGILGAFYHDRGNLACLLEVNCETDFVVKTDDFQHFVAQATKLVQGNPFQNVSDLLKANYNGKQTVQDALTALVAKVGENIQVKRFVRWEAKFPQEKLGFYLHAGSKIGVLVLITDASSKISGDVAKEVAMHIAAMNPKYLRQTEISNDVLEKEREIQKATLDPKKPLEIQNKIIEGKLSKFFSEVCLEEQIFVKDPEGKLTVSAWLKKQSPSARVEKFVRLQVGT